MATRKKHQWVRAGAKAPVSFHPIAIDISAAIHQRMIGLDPHLGSLAPHSDLTKVALMQRFVPSARLEAIARYQATGERGLILCDQRHTSLQLFFVAQPDSSTALWMATGETKQLVADLLKVYNPDEEAVVIMVTETVIQPIWIEATNQIRATGPQPLAQMPLQLPPEVSYQQQVTPEGLITYVFTHQQLGVLGRILLVPRTPQETEFRYEVFGTVDDALRSARAEIFGPIAQEIIRRLEMGLK